MKTSNKPCAGVTLQAALDMGPPAPGDLAIPVFRHGTLEVEMYAPGATDKQTPHERDEVYVVARGSARFYDGNDRRDVEPGMFLFVPAGQLHRFEALSADFAVWVLFYGPEGGEANS